MAYFSNGTEGDMDAGYVRGKGEGYGHGQYVRFGPPICGPCVEVTSGGGVRTPKDVVEA